MVSNLFRLTYLVAAALIVACQAQNVGVATEPLDCNSKYLGDSFVTVKGNARYYTREQLPTGQCGLGNEVLKGPIRFAEVQVVDSYSGNIIQCGETDNNGDYSLRVPPNKKLKLKIVSRSNGLQARVSVLDTPDSANLYSLDTPILTGDPNTTINVDTLEARATGAILGGAFNILNDVVQANESIRYHVCGTDTSTTCAHFTVAPKVTAYWKAGVNPYVYVGGPESSGLSFYVTGSRKLYILGGVQGNTDTADTDHFDDSVISHEYTHFLEDVFAKTDSPGGSHDGNHIVDPRLAWGEGWANFFSAAVTASKTYRDTYGNISGSTGCYFDYDIDKNSPSLDSPSSDGEGNFREFAITRALWDAIDPIALKPGSLLVGSAGTSADDNSSDAVSDGADSTFKIFWQVFVTQWQLSSTHFRNVGLFFEFAQNAAVNAYAIPQAKIKNSRVDYGTVLPTAGSSCSAKSMTANDPTSCTIGSTTVCQRGQRHHCCSNQLASNDFYDVNVDGTISTISIQRATGSADFDLYLYKENYVFGNDTSDAIKSSNTTSGDETINLSGVPQGHYILNVSISTASGSNPATSSYRIYVNGTEVCP